jgi:energy-coupling factor transporter ATP-binding protein EcfA2
MKRADDLAGVIRLFDPRKPLSGEALQAFYIDRPGNPLQRMQTYLQGLGLAGQPVKLLFTGHVGSGKSTELNRLATLLKSQFFIVNLDVRRSLNLADLTYVDILLGLTTALFHRATEEDVLAKAPAQIAADVWEDVSLFIEHTILGPVHLPTPSKTGAEFSAKVNLLAAGFEAKFSQETSTRQAVRDQMQSRVAELVDKLDFVARQVRDRYKRPVLFFIENTDKPDLDTARALFLNHTHSLTAFEAAAIYTFPVGLRYSPDFTLIKDLFDHHFVLPNIKVNERDGDESPECIEHLRRAVELRADLGLFDPEALNMIIRASGGLIRTLIRLVQGAAIHALSAGQDRITPESALAAISEERADYIAALSADDYTVLAERMQDKELSSDKAVERLLQSWALMEYANGTPWCDVHPVIRDLVKERAKEGSTA